MEGGSEDHAEKPSLILVDSSVWIDFLSSCPSRAGAELRRMVAEAEPFALAGVVVTEVLQALRREVSRIEHYLSKWACLNQVDSEPIGKQRSFFGQHVREVSRLRLSTP
jgi:predicted nucleic acid-binding protein